MAILLTGGTGKTSVRCARLCKDAVYSFVLASRKAVSTSDMPAVKLDYADSSTFENAFKHQFPNGEKITAIYLIAPELPDPAPAMIAFINYAVQQHDVKRFVFMTGNTTEPGPIYVGPVWQHLKDIDVDHTVLRCSWFMEQFSDQQYFQAVKNESKFYTANGDGKAPWVSSSDIAKVVFKVITDEKPHNTDYRVLGPEQLTCDDIAAILSKHLGREVNHIKLTPEERVKKYTEIGFPEPLAQFMTSLEVRTADGLEERPGKDFEQVTGEKGQTFDDWVQENKQVWL